MLNPNNDRLYYGKILSPPTNYELDFAIGTTYTLDLDALVGASISLGLSEDIDSDLIDNSIFLLEALRSTSDKIALFCQNGQIKLPTNTTPLYILIENMVFQVKTSKAFKENRYASFHPKFWLLRYKDKEENTFYRLVVLSRNLTFDRSWDISFTMDGYKNEETTNKNDAIINFIDYLANFSSDPVKTEVMHDLMNELKHVEFNLKSNIFNDFEFFVNGIDAEHNILKSQLFEDDSLNELMVVSPFLSKDVIRDFNDRKTNDSKALLFTRLNSIEPLKHRDCSNFEVYTLRDDVIDGESQISEEAQDILKQDIHAKIYAIETNGNLELYLGSLNASHNALYGNVEFMIRLQAKNKKLNVMQVADDLFNGDKGGPKDPFQLRNVEDYKLEENGEENDLDLILKYISRLDSKATVSPNDEYYDITVDFEDFDETIFKGLNVSIKPLLSSKTIKFSQKTIFNKLNKLSLSEFFVISIDDDLGNDISRIIKIPANGMPNDRQKEVVSSIITNENDFIKYVAFLLGDEFILTVENNLMGNVGTSMDMQLPELYEKMLKSSIYAPEKFRELEFLINALSDDNVVPEGFEEMYDTFVEVLEND